MAYLLGHSLRDSPTKILHVLTLGSNFIANAINFFALLLL